MKKLADMDYADAERVKTLRSVLRSMTCTRDRLMQAPPQKHVQTNVTRIALLNEDIEKAQTELAQLLDDTLPSVEIGG